MIDRAQAFAAIWEKATGGREVAIDPHLAKAAEFNVPAAPGVEEACDWLRRAAEAGERPAMVFLVGGPGGGKSHAVTRAARGFVEQGVDESGLAQRTYHFAVGSSRLTVVNDASIRSGADRHPLADEIGTAVDRGDFLLACVNRGILVEEANAITRGSVGATVVAWLAGLEPTYEGPAIVDSSSESSSLITKATLLADGSEVDLVVVHVDHCSMFELRPEVDDQLVAGQYRIKRLKDRAVMDVVSTPGGALLDMVVDHLAAAASPTDDRFDPLHANVQSLSSLSVQRGVLTALRASEVVGGGRFTFREVWGAILRMLAGDLPQSMDPEEAIELFGSIDAASDASTRFNELQSRAQYRFSEALFGGGSSSADIFGDPVLRYTSAVDPTLDASPGSLTDGGYGWASPVLDAFSGLITSASPLETLIQGLSETDPFLQAVSEFDRELDSSFVRLTETEAAITDRQRRDAVAWYGDYLSRLYAVANGVTAYRAEVAMWLESRGALPSELEQRLKTLMRPSRDPSDVQSGYLLPLFRSRTIPLGPVTLEWQVALQGEQAVELRAQRRGDEVSIEMIEAASLVGEIELDFALIRSALACKEQRLGVTEQAARVGPRVERFRAKRLTSARVARGPLRLVGPSGVSDVHMEA